MHCLYLVNKHITLATELWCRIIDGFPCFCYFHFHNQKVVLSDSTILSELSLIYTYRIYYIKHSSRSKQFQISDIWDFGSKVSRISKIGSCTCTHILSWTHKYYVLRIQIKFQLLLKLELIRNRIEMIETHEKKTWFLAILNFRLWESTLAWVCLER